ncbi:unnamed protein product [Amoebophrya sp. A120]|nr:unnamed protein product [Amoebophrya sp. A120]|eukprot:GSA120T00006500001.1
MRAFSLSGGLSFFSMRLADGTQVRHNSPVYDGTVKKKSAAPLQGPGDRVFSSATKRKKASSRDSTLSTNAVSTGSSAPSATSDDRDFNGLDQKVDSHDWEKNLPRTTSTSNVADAGVSSFAESTNAQHAIAEEQSESEGGTGVEEEEKQESAEGTAGPSSSLTERKERRSRSSKRLRLHVVKDTEGASVEAEPTSSSSGSVAQKNAPKAPFVVKDFCSIDADEKKNNQLHFSADEKNSSERQEGHDTKNFVSSGVEKPVDWPSNFTANAVKFPVQCEQPDWLLRSDQLVLPVNSENASGTKTKAGISATMVMTMYLSPNAPGDWKNPASDNAPADWLHALFAANVQILRHFGHGLILRTEFTPDEYDGKTNLKKWQVDSEECRGKSAEECIKWFDRINLIFEKQLMLADYLNLERNGTSSGSTSRSTTTVTGEQDHQARYRFTHVFSLDADAALVSTAFDSVGLAAWNLAQAKKDVFAANEDWQVQENKANWQQNQFCDDLNGGFLLVANNAFSRTFFKDMFAAHKRGPKAEAWETAELSSAAVACTLSEQPCLRSILPRLRQHFLVTSGQLWNRARFDTDKAAPAVNSTVGREHDQGYETRTTHVLHYMDADGRMAIAAQDFCQPGFLVNPIEMETRAALGVCGSPANEVSCAKTLQLPHDADDVREEEGSTSAPEAPSQENLYAMTLV